MPQYKIARVAFNGSPKLYDYKTDIEDLKAKDHAVVCTKGEYNVVFVYDVVDSTTVPEDYLKWLVCKVDKTNYIKKLGGGD